MDKWFIEIAFEAELNTEEHPELMELAPEMCNEHPDTRAAAIQELRDMIYGIYEANADDSTVLRNKLCLLKHAMKFPEEHPELMELAPEMCNEHPDTRAAAIQELRDMLYERGECRPRRTDDAFLLRFLRMRRFVVPRAHRQLVRYCEFMERYPELYKGVDFFGLERVGHAYEGTMLDRPDVGRLVIMRFGTWDLNEYPVEDLVKAGMAIMETGLRTPKMQILGGTLIVDMEGINIRHIATLTPTIAYQIVCLLGLATPSTMKSCHVINYNWLLNTFFFLFRRIISKKAWRSIHFHGWDLESLHQHIDPECLPKRYGGTCRVSSDIGTWFTKIRKYRDESFDKEMKEMGYIMKG